LKERHGEITQKCHERGLTSGNKGVYNEPTCLPLGRYAQKKEAE